ncbi:hypothetical protein VDR22_12540, partial [Xanthomonas campestris pv. campestris]|nr:hypothetical protein [Xanthomonas campestris pv. campestris]
ERGGVFGHLGHGLQLRHVDRVVGVDMRWDCLAIAADVWRRSGGRQSTFVRCLGNVADQGDSCV